MKDFKRGGVLLFLVCLLAIGCAKQLNNDSLEERAFKILSTSLSIYNLTMTSVAELQLDGYIDVYKRAEINEWANRYRLAHLSGARALYAYKKLGDATNEQRLLVAVDEASKALNDFIGFVEPILKERLVK